MLQQRVLRVANLIQSWKIVLIMKEILWINNVNFVENVPNINVNFFTTVITDSEKQRSYQFRNKS